MASNEYGRAVCVERCGASRPDCLKRALLHLYRSLKMRVTPQHAFREPGREPRLANE